MSIEFAALNSLGSWLEIYFDFRQNDRKWLDTSCQSGALI